MTPKRYLAPLIISLLFIVTSFRLFRPGFLSLQDDMHLFRLQQFDTCLHDGQLPCRLIPDGGLGYSYPLFNYYPPLTYAIAECFHLLGFSFFNSLKLLLILTNLLRPIGIFLLASSLFGVSGGLVSTILFTLAPYQALNGYVRGAIAENLAITLIPFTLYYLHRQKYYLFTLFLCFLFLTHHLTLLYFLPLLFIYAIFFQLKHFPKIIFYSVLGLLLSAFFVFPAVIEKRYVTVETMTQGYFYYVNHFATLKQLFIDRSWGYGASLWGPVDDMSFQIGFVQWLLPLLTAIVLIVKKQFRFPFALSILGLFALFLTHNQSTFIWKALPFLAYYQFPWRFLGLAIICFSLSAGYFPHFIKQHFHSIFILVLLLFTVFLNLNYFKEDIWYPNLTDTEKLTGQNLINQSAAGLKDYWPKFGTDFPLQFSEHQIQLQDGLAVVLNFKQSSYQLFITIDVTSPTATINLPLVYFPHWQYTLDNLSATYTIQPKYGLIQTTLPQGQHYLKFSFVNTPLRTISNLLSLLAIILYIFLLFRAKKP